jgi:hypothetical protein
MAPMLCSVPGEIIQVIATKLPHKDILNLRLVSKELNDKTFHHFSHVCFGTFQTDLSLKSMKDLEDLSNQKHLRRFLHTLLIQCTPMSPGEPYKALGNTLGRGFVWARNSAGHLTAPQPGLEVLFHLLTEKLVNCKSFRIDNAFDPNEKQGESLGPSILTTLDALTSIFSMIAEKGLDVTSFGIHLHRGCENFSRLDIQQTKTPEFLKSWANLQSLYIDSLDVIPGELDWIMGLIEHATNLQRLTLSCDQLWGFVLIHRASPLRNLAQLEELRLQAVYVPEQTLLALLSRLKLTLRVLVLDRVELHRGTWPLVLGTIARLCPHLKDFSIAHPWTRRGDLAFIPTVFPLLSFNPLVLQSANGFIRFTITKLAGQRQVIGVKYRGLRMAQLLTLLSESAVECQTPRLPSAPRPQLRMDPNVAEGGQRYRLSYSYTGPSFCMRFGEVVTIIFKGASGKQALSIEK